jgi:hypothetical protein
MEPRTPPRTMVTRRRVVPFFLSHPTPAEVAVRAGRAELIRPRIEPTEWLDRQLLPTWD